MFGVDDVIIAALISAAAGAATSAATPAPKNKTVATGEAAGGAPTTQAQNIFQQGQPGQSPQAPPPVMPQGDGGAGASIGSILSQAAPQAMNNGGGVMAMPGGPQPAPQVASNPALNVPNSPLMPTPPPDFIPKPQAPLSVPNSPQPSAQTGPAAKPPAASSMKVGDVIGMFGQSADALAKLAPLLGFGEGQQKSMHTAGAAGGMGGQNVFALPQRQTLAQILASLPRTM